MKLFRKLTVLLLAFAVTAGSLAGCGGQNTPPASGTAMGTPAASEGSRNLDEGGVTRAEGLPITSEPVTIRAAVNFSTIMPDKDKTNIWKYVAEKTNLNFQIDIYKESEKVDLMFASRDYPDLLMGVGIKGAQLANGAEAGDFVELESLLEQYAPTWNTFMKENKLVYNASLAADGKLYSLPYIDFAPFDRNLRDQWIVMESWLGELGLTAPTTTEEFKNALEQIKANAGKGTIPADVIPYYFFFDNYVGGQFDIYSSFGVYVTDGDYVFVDNGTVRDQSTNPDIKEPLKYLRELYTQGLIPPEVFTDDWNTYVSKISSNPPVVGSYHSYANRQPELATAMGPLDSGNGKTPYIRSQAYTPGPAHTAIITYVNKYPVATVRFFEEIAASTEMLLTVSRGTKGVVWDTNEQGKAYQLFWEESPDKMTEYSLDLGLHNSFIALKDKNFYENVWEEISYSTVNSRAWAYDNVYKSKVMPNEMVYVGGALSADDTNLINQYRTDLANYRKNMYAQFITGKLDIDAQWDTFTKQMKALGLDEFIKLKQKAYDVMIK